MKKRFKVVLNNFILPFFVFLLGFVCFTSAWAQPVSPNDIGFQGLRLIDQGQVEQGMKLVNQAVDADPTNASWRLNIANLLYAQGLKHLKEGDIQRANNIWSFAEMHLQEAKNLFHPSRDKILLSEAYFVMGEIQQYGHQNYDQAKIFYQKALNLYEHPRAARAMEKLQ